MRIKPLLALAGLFTVTATPLTLAQAVRHSLVIGNDSYPGNKLKNARNDARSMAATLRAMGYVSTLALDLNQKEMESEVDEFASSIKKGDIVLVYYAGHGLQVAGENYLVPIDFQVSDEADVKYRGLPLSALLDKLTTHGASTEIIILDACRDNPFLSSRSTNRGWASVGTSAGTFLAFGTAPGSTASDDPFEDHGLFTKSLLKLASAPVDIEQMFQLVRQDVIAQSGGEQVPWTSSSLIGSLHLDPAADRNAPDLARLDPNATRSASHSNERSIGTRTAIGERPAPAVDPENTRQRDDLLVSAVAELRGARFDKALVLLEDVLSLDPAFAAGFRLLGAACHLLGKDAEAITALNRALELDPDDALALSYRCLVVSENDPVASTEDCKRAIDLRPDLTPAHIGLAVDLASLGQSKDAYNEAERAVELDPSSAAAYSLRGELDSLLKRPDLAAADFKRAMSITLSSNPR